MHKVPHEVARQIEEEVTSTYDTNAPTETVEHGEDDIVRELLCEMCGRDYPVWSADSDLWNEVMRVDGVDEYAFVCPTCFTVRAAFMGVETSFRLRRSAPREVVAVHDGDHLYFCASWPEHHAILVPKEVEDGTVDCPTCGNIMGSVTVRVGPPIGDEGGQT